jgi:5-methylcytosine-specific restriction endonuclease McrA
MPRYRKPRVMVNWHKTCPRQIAKMLSWKIKAAEGLGQYALFERFKELYPGVCKGVLGYDYSYEDLQTEIVVEYGFRFRPNRLYQRADKAQRYGEWNPQKQAVEVAYGALTGQSKVPPGGRDPRRCFTDAEVLDACIRQGHVCGSCPSKLGPYNPPVGGHMIPWSQGGPTTSGNCVAQCSPCNIEMGDMHFIFFCQKKARKMNMGRKNIYPEA